MLPSPLRFRCFYLPYCIENYSDMDLFFFVDEKRDIVAVPLGNDSDDSSYCDHLISFLERSEHALLRGMPLFVWDVYKNIYCEQKKEGIGQKKT